jgi:hypothetical protein
MMKERDIYRRVYLRLWRHRNFLPLLDGEKVLALYLVTGPQTNQIGCYYFSPMLACEDLGITPSTLQQQLRVVCGAFEWEWHEDCRLLYVPSWFTWNKPNSANAVKGWLDEARKVADPTLKQRVEDAILTTCARRNDDVVTQEAGTEAGSTPQPPAARGARSRRVSKLAIPSRGVTGPCPACGVGDDGPCCVIAECRQRQLALERAKVSA